MNDDIPLFCQLTCAVSGERGFGCSWFWRLDEPGVGLLELFNKDKPEKPSIRSDKLYKERECKI